MQGVNGSFPVIMVKVKETTSPLPPHTMLNTPFSHRPLYTLYYKSKKLVMENIRGGLCVCVCVCVCVWGGGEQGVCENGGGLEISPFGVTTLSGKRGGGMRG